MASEDRIVAYESSNVSVEDDYSKKVHSRTEALVEVICQFEKLVILRYSVFDRRFFHSKRFRRFIIYNIPLGYETPARNIEIPTNKICDPTLPQTAISYEII